MTKNEILVRIHAVGQTIEALGRTEFAAYLRDLGVPEEETDDVRAALVRLSRVWLPKESAAGQGAGRVN